MLSVKCFVISYFVFKPDTCWRQITTLANQCCVGVNGILVTLLNIDSLCVISCFQAVCFTRKCSCTGHVVSWMLHNITSKDLAKHLWLPWQCRLSCLLQDDFCLNWKHLTDLLFAFITWPENKSETVLFFLSHTLSPKWLYLLVFLFKCSLMTTWNEWFLYECQIKCLFFHQDMCCFSIMVAGRTMNL